MMINMNKEYPNNTLRYFPHLKSWIRHPTGFAFRRIRMVHVHRFQSWQCTCNVNKSWGPRCRNLPESMLVVSVCDMRIEAFRVSNKVSLHGYGMLCPSTQPLIRQSQLCPSPREICVTFPCVASAHGVGSATGSRPPSVIFMHCSFTAP